MFVENKIVLITQDIICQRVSYCLYTGHLDSWDVTFRNLFGYEKFSSKIPLPIMNISIFHRTTLSRFSALDNNIKIQSKCGS